MAEPVIDSRPMTRDALRAAIQPHLGRDFDAVYDAFARQSGTSDPQAFVDDLADKGMLPPNTASTLRAKIASSKGPPPPPSVGPS